MSSGLRQFITGSLCFFSMCLPETLLADNKVEISQSSASPHVRYVSGGISYLEQLLNGHWVDRDLAIGEGAGRHAWTGDAFGIRIKSDPNDTTAGVRLDKWRFVSTSENAGGRTGEHEAVVQLASTTRPITLKVHTLLDGTAVLTRWLEITNTGQRSVALTQLSVWS